MPVPIAALLIPLAAQAVGYAAGQLQRVESPWTHYSALAPGIKKMPGQGVSRELLKDMLGQASNVRIAAPATGRLAGVPFAGERMSQAAQGQSIRAIRQFEQGLKFNAARNRSSSLRQIAGTLNEEGKANTFYKRGMMDAMGQKSIRLTTEQKARRQAIQEIVSKGAGLAGVTAWGISNMGRGPVGPGAGPGGGDGTVGSLGVEHPSMEGAGNSGLMGERAMEEFEAEIGNILL